MKIFGLIASLILTFSSIGQKSYYFSSPYPNNIKEQVSVSKKWFGKYSLNKGKHTYEIDRDGISMITTSISSISREQIRESSQYDVRDNYIFGVVENDSIPCVLDGERYFFGIRNKEVIVGAGSKNELRASGRSSNEYILSTYENGYYIPSIIRFESKQLFIEQLDYDLETTVFEFIELKKNVAGKNIELVILSPTDSEFNTLISNTAIFSILKEFKRIK